MKTEDFKRMSLESQAFYLLMERIAVALEKLVALDSDK